MHLSRNARSNSGCSPASFRDRLPPAIVIQLLLFPVEAELCLKPANRETVESTPPERSPRISNATVNLINSRVRSVISRPQKCESLFGYCLSMMSRSRVD